MDSKVKQRVLTKQEEFLSRPWGLSEGGGRGGPQRTRGVLELGEAGALGVRTAQRADTQTGPQTLVAAVGGPSERGGCVCCGHCVDEESAAVVVGGEHTACNFVLFKYTEACFMA